ncbi:MAG: hypothetical protein RIQ93_2973 [Verrucomicrobiota bacterium]|jgi:ADP-heptose:LPS heptosyltransferase
MRKILVLRGGALGDFIVALPALALLRERWPATEITLIGNAQAAALAHARGLVQEVFSQHEARWSALYSAAPLPPPLTAWLETFDLIVNFWPDPQLELQRHFPVRAGQLFLSGDAAPSVAPAARHYCETLRPLGLEPANFRFRLAPSPPSGSSPGAASVKQCGDESRVIAIHPGSGSPRKNWPSERWLAVMRTLVNPVLFILGEAELERWSGSLSSLSDNVRCAVNRPLEALVTELNHCRLFLGQDSGISHLAAACGVPCLLLFGPTDPVVWAPPGPAIRVLRRESGLDSISVTEYEGALKQALAEHR